MKLEKTCIIILQNVFSVRNGESKISKSPAIPANGEILQEKK